MDTNNTTLTNESPILGILLDAGKDFIRKHVPDFLEMFWYDFLQPIAQKNLENVRNTQLARMSRKEDINYIKISCK